MLLTRNYSGAQFFEKLAPCGSILFARQSRCECFRITVFIGWFRECFGISQLQKLYYFASRWDAGARRNARADKQRRLTMVFKESNEVLLQLHVAALHRALKAEGFECDPGIEAAESTYNLAANV